MIHEIRTYDLKPGGVPGFLERTAEKIEQRVAVSPLVGFFFTEIGPRIAWSISGSTRTRPSAKP